jgi:hypothetical protein
MLIRIRDGKKFESGIRDKHPGSAILFSVLAKFRSYSTDGNVRSLSFSPKVRSCTSLDKVLFFHVLAKDLDAYKIMTDSDLDPGPEGPNTYGSGSTPLLPIPCILM